ALAGEHRDLLPVSKASERGGNLISLNLYSCLWAYGTTHATQAANGGNSSMKDRKRKPCRDSK
ncbi:unnamed protein product, partial [Polarella glacialis]